MTWNGQTVQPESDGSYRLPDGAYSYTVKAKGYAKVVEPLNVTKDATVPVTLTPSTAWDGAEKEQPGGSGTQTDPYQIGSGAGAGVAGGQGQQRLQRHKVLCGADGRH